MTGLIYLLVCPSLIVTPNGQISPGLKAPGSDKKVTFSAPAMPAARLIPELGKRIGIKLVCGPEVGADVLLLNVTDRPASEVLQKLADAKEQAKRDAKTLFSGCRVNGLPEESRVRTAVAQVIARKPRGYLGILSHFQRLVKLDVARRTALVESAVPLAPAFAESVRANLERKHGAGLDLTFTANAALVGGLRIKVGSDVYDGSVKTRLESLAESF